MLLARLAATVGGAALTAYTVLAAVRSVVLPRATPIYLNELVVRTLRAALNLFTKRDNSFSRRDRVLAFLGPLALLSLPGVWITLILLAFTAIFWGTGIDPLSEAFVTSGSSVFTLGFARPEGTGRAAVAFVEAGLGVGLLALLISYLPTIYGAFAKREALVASLEVRAGLPPSPVELLTRYSRVHLLASIDEELFSRWEEWFLEIEESHTSIPALAYFRSPQPARSWITAAGCVLDTAAIYESLMVHPPSGHAPVMMRTGFFTLRRIADAFGIAYDDDPHPDDPISVSRREFDLVCVELSAAGVELRRDREAAWLAFRGWRVNYDRVLVALAHHIDAPEGRWSSDRPAITPPEPVRRPRRGRRRQ